MPVRSFSRPSAPLAQAAPRRFRFLEEFTGLDDLQALLKQAIRDDEDDHRLPFTIREGDFIRRGYDEEVDHVREVIAPAERPPPAAGRTAGTPGR